jgi:hypothetical protein
VGFPGIPTASPQGVTPLNSVSPIRCAFVTFATTLSQRRKDFAAQFGGVEYVSGYPTSAFVILVSPQASPG